MVRFDLSDWEWANLLVERNYRPDRTAAAVICGLWNGPAADQIGGGGVDEQRERGPTLGRKVRRAVTQISSTECPFLGWILLQNSLI